MSEYVQRIHEFDSPEALLAASGGTLDDGRPRTYVTKVGDSDFDVGVFADGKSISSGNIHTDQEVGIRQAAAMAAVLDGQKPSEIPGVAATSVSTNTTHRLREFSNESEALFFESKKRDSGDDTPLIYFFRRPHPVPLNGEKIVYYETGILNGQNQIKLGVFPTKNEARDFAVEFHGAMTPAQESDSNTTLIGRLAQITDSFGERPASTEEIALAAKQLYYPERPFNRVLASVRSKLYNCDRYFDAEKGGRWRLTEDGRAIAQDGVASPRIDGWIAATVLQEEKPKVEDLQDLLFDDGAKSEDKDAAWKASSVSRARLRAGIFIAMGRKKLPPSAGGMLFGARVGDFLRGVTKSIPESDIIWIGQMLEVPPAKLKCKHVESAKLANGVKSALELQSADINIEEMRSIREKTRGYLTSDRKKRDVSRLNAALAHVENRESLISPEIQAFMEGGKHPGAAIITRNIRQIRSASCDAAPASERPKSSVEPPSQALLELNSKTSPAAIVHEKYRNLDYSHSLYRRKTTEGWQVGLVNDKNFTPIAERLQEEDSKLRAENILAGRANVREAVENLVGLSTDPSSDLTRVDFKHAGSQKTLGL